MQANRVDVMTQPSSPSLTTTTADRKITFAPCVLDRGRHSWVWIVPACPYCGKCHDHYAGPLDSDPHLYIGRLFAARCDATDRQRLSPQYSTSNLWYVLEPIQTKAQPQELSAVRAIGEK